VELGQRQRRSPEAGDHPGVDEHEGGIHWWAVRDSNP
jgi:hypothetical protein